MSSQLFLAAEVVTKKLDKAIDLDGSQLGVCDSVAYCGQSSSAEDALDERCKQGWGTAPARLVPSRASEELSTSNF